MCGVEARLGREPLGFRERVPRTSSAQPRLYQHRAGTQSSAGQVFSMMRAPLRSVILAPGQRLTAASSAIGMGNVCVRMAKFACRHHSLRHIRRRLVTGTPPNPYRHWSRAPTPMSPQTEVGARWDQPRAPRADDRFVRDSVQTLNNLEATRIAALRSCQISNRASRFVQEVLLQLA